MKIIVGLGNPGIKYAGSRHNTGFSVATELSDKFDIPFNKKECKAVTGHGFISGEKVVLAMPQTFMNLSGEAVSELLSFYKCEVSDLIIIYDDIDLDVGKLRIRTHGSAEAKFLLLGGFGHISDRNGRVRQSKAGSR